MAHLAEHLWFQARPDGQDRVMDQLYAMGAEFNAFTMRDAMAFETVVHKDQLGTVLTLEQQRFLSGLASIDDALVLQEQRIIQHETQKPSFKDVASRALAPQLFPKPHPYHGMTQALEVQQTTNIKRADVSNWWSQHMLPELATLHVVGDFSPIQLQAEILSTWPASLVGPNQGACPSRTTAGANPKPPAPVQKPTSVAAPVDQRHLVFGWSLPPAYRGNDLVLPRVSADAESTLREHLTSQYNRQTRKRMAPWCGAVEGAVNSLLVCSVKLGPMQHARTLATELIRSVASHIPRKDPGAYKSIGGRLLRAQADMTLQGGGATYHRLLMQTHFTGRMSALADQMDALTQSTNIGDAIWPWITEERSVWATLERSEELQLAAVEPPHLPLPSAKTEVRGLAAVPRTTIESRTLANGMKVVYAPMGDAPVAHVALLQPEHGPFNVRIMHEGMDSEADYAAPGDVVVPLNDFGAAGQSTTHDRHRLTTATGPTDAQRAILSAVLAQGAGGELDYDWYRTVWSWNPPPLASLVAVGHSHLGVEGTMETEMPSRSQLRKAHAVHHRPDNAILVLSGSFSREEVDPILHELSEKWAPGTAAQAEPHKLAPLPHEPTLLTQQHETTLVRIACRVEGTPAQMDVLKAAVHTSLMTTAREQQGAIYTPTVRVHTVPDEQWLFEVKSTTRPSLAGPVLQAFDDSLRGLSPWTDLAKARAVGEWSLAVNTPAGFAEHVGLATARGEDPLARGADIDAVTTQQLVDLGQACVSHRVAMVGGPDAAMESLREAGFEPVQ